MNRRIVATIIVGFFVFLGAGNAVGQKSGQTDPNIEAEIKKIVRDYYDAWSRFDEKAVMSLHDDAGFYYSVRSGYETFETVNKAFRSYFKMPESTRTRFSYEIDDIKVTTAGTETAIANYKIATKMTQGATVRDLDERYTNIFVKRQGIWKLVAEHSSDLPMPVADVVSGMPLGWIRTPIANAERYSMTVDTSVKHGGNASAMLGFACGDPSGFGSLAQSIAADEYIGKRIRLTGWLKTEKAEEAGLWMRLDGMNRLLGFDNMSPRAVKGTTDWKQYDVVLDVPAGTVNILFGALLVGTGRAWIDDLKIETVGKEVPTTNQLSPEQMQVESSNRGLKKSVSKQPVNLGFEDGTRP